jgi:UDP-2-acetamido-3-amino-2,3-dideoxy-glucuronate N-acetyltransferase
MNWETDVFIAESALVEEEVRIGQQTKVWNGAQIRSGAVIGDNCVIGRDVFIDHGVIVGNNCKIQNNAQLYSPCLLGDRVFIGPGVILTNDEQPRAVDFLGNLKTEKDWNPVRVEVREGASLGAGVICVAPIIIGRWSMVGAGAVVTQDIPDYALSVGVPAKRIGWVGKFGRRLVAQDGSQENWICPSTGEIYKEFSGKLERLNV